DGDEALERLREDGDRVRRVAEQIPAQVPRRAAASQGRAVLPGREQAPRARELRDRAWNSADQVTRLSQGESMMLKVRMAASRVMVTLAFAVLGIPTPQPVAAGSAGQIDSEVNAAFGSLLRSNSEARFLNEKAVGVLVFPNIVKAGFLFGAQYGEGALR